MDVSSARLARTVRDEKNGQVIERRLRQFATAWIKGSRIPLVSKDYAGKWHTRNVVNNIGSVLSDLQTVLDSL
jgi:hypothetical protein